MTQKTKEESPDLNFRTATQAHIEWEIRLKAFISGESDEKLVYDVISADNNCILGKWIHGKGGEKFGDSHDFKLLQHIHACFHLQAGEVVAFCTEGKRDRATTRLESEDYRFFSDRVKLLLAKLNLTHRSAGDE